MNTIPLLIADPNLNLSTTWCETLKYVIDHPGLEITPCIISITNFEESDKIKNVLNSSLLSNDMEEVEAVSETIFPQSLYELFDYNRHTLYDEYLNSNLPRLKKFTQAIDVGRILKD